MAQLLDLTKFSFSAEQIRDINELVYDNLLHAPDLNYIHTMYSGIVYDQEIGFITSSGLVGKKGQSCVKGTVIPTQDWGVNTRRVLWEPKTWEVFIGECATDLENSAVVYCQNKGTRMDDLTDTDYMTIVVNVLTDAVRDFMYRLIWFSDMDAANHTEGGEGIITAGVDVDYFNVINGLFKQLRLAGTRTPNLLVPIAANGKPTKQEQLSAMDADAAYDLLNSMYYKAPVELRSSGKMRFLVTQSIADGYQQYLTGKGIESTYTNLVKGINSLTFLGVPVIPLPIWDQMIQSYNDLGAAFYKPHRALLVEQANLAVGTPSEEAYDQFKIWYNDDTRETKVLVKNKLDAKLLASQRLVYAQ